MNLAWAQLGEWKNAVLVCVCTFQAVAFLTKVQFLDKSHLHPIQTIQAKDSVNSP